VVTSNGVSNPANMPKNDHSAPVGARILIGPRSSPLPASVATALSPGTGYAAISSISGANPRGCRPAGVPRRALAGLSNRRH
jgi:hypothetical protein